MARHHYHWSHDIIIDDHVTPLMIIIDHVTSLSLITWHIIIDHVTSLSLTTWHHYHWSCDIIIADHVRDGVIIDHMTVLSLNTWWCYRWHCDGLVAHQLHPVRLLEELRQRVVHARDDLVDGFLPWLLAIFTSFQRLEEFPQCWLVHHTKVLRYLKLDNQGC